MVWQNINEELTQLFEKDTSPEGYEGFITAVIKTKNIEESISYQMGVFEEAVICVNSHICDRKTINNYLLKNGKIFFNKYYPFVCKQREMWNDPTIWQEIQQYYNPKSIGKICT